MLRVIPLTIALLAWLGVEFDLGLPEELALLAADLECKDVPGFYDRPEMVGSAYLYGYAPGPKEASAVFWCMRNSGTAWLFVAVRDGAVSSYFEWSFGYPGGLSLAESRAMPLSSFWYVNETSTRGPEGVRTSYRPVVSESDGVREYFYEHEGRWLFLPID